MFRSARFILALVIVGASAAHAQEAAVTPAEIQDTWVGKTLVGTAANGAPVTMMLQANGSASLVAGSTSDSGTWRVSENGYCTTWKGIRAGQERCFSTRRAGTELTVSNPDGSLSGYFTDIR